MWMSTEDARSDVILAGATAVLGTAIVAFVQSLPLYPRGTLVATLLGLGWLFALSGLVPWLLTRYRKLGAESYGLDAGREGWRPGLLLALPIALAGVLRGYSGHGDILPALLGRLAPSSLPDPTISAEDVGASLFDGVVLVLFVLVLIAGSLLLYTFLTVRGRNAFAPTEQSVTQLIRTIGMGSAAAALVFGLLRSIGAGLTVVVVLVSVVALVALVLLADRLVPPRVTTSRGAVLAPVVAAVLGHLLPAFRGDLLFGLFLAALAAGVVTTLASLVEGRQHAWAIVPPIVAMAVYPTCLVPLPVFGLGFLGCVAL